MSKDTFFTFGFIAKNAGEGKYHMVLYGGNHFEPPITFGHLWADPPPPMWHHLWTKKTTGQFSLKNHSKWPNSPPPEKGPKKFLPCAPQYFLLCIWCYAAVWRPSPITFVSFLADPALQTLETTFIYNKGANCLYKNWPKRIKFLKKSCRVFFSISQITSSSGLTFFPYHF